MGQAQNMAGKSDAVFQAEEAADRVLGPGRTELRLGARQARIGDHHTVNRVMLRRPGVGEEPTVILEAEIVRGTPRVRRLTFEGKNVRQRDIQAVRLDAIVEVFAALASPSKEARVKGATVMDQQA